jgi:hypothetical protein
MRKQALIMEKESRLTHSAARFNATREMLEPLYTEVGDLTRRNPGHTVFLGDSSPDLREVRLASAARVGQMLEKYKTFLADFESGRVASAVSHIDCTKEAIKLLDTIRWLKVKHEKALQDLLN